MKAIEKCFQVGEIMFEIINPEIFSFFLPSEEFLEV